MPEHSIPTYHVGDAARQAIAAVAADIRLARFACGHHISRAVESQIRLVAPRSVSEMGVLRDPS